MDKFSYALGLGIGQQLKQMGLKDTLVIEDFAASIVDVLQDNDLKVSNQEAQVIVRLKLARLPRKRARLFLLKTPRRKASPLRRAVCNMRCSKRAQVSSQKLQTLYVATTKDACSMALSSTAATSAMNQPTLACSRSLLDGPRVCSSCQKDPSIGSTSHTCLPMVKVVLVLPFLPMLH